MFKTEICANSVESCIAAQNGGADRVELCSGISEGGTTPSYGEIAVARESLRIKLHVIIRPRGGDFLYNETETRIMEHDILQAKKLGADGVVFGCLTADGEIDIPLCKRLLTAAQGLSVTFHRAFDQCVNPLKALEQLIDLGFHRILTSGQQPTAEEGISLIKQLVQQANNRIIILPGSGINERNIAKIASETGASEFHFSARQEKQSEMVYRVSAVPMNSSAPGDQYTSLVTTPERVKNTIEALNS